MCVQLSTITRAVRCVTVAALDAVANVVPELTGPHTWGGWTATVPPMGWGLGMTHTSKENFLLGMITFLSNYSAALYSALNLRSRTCMAVFSPPVEVTHLC